MYTKNISMAMNRADPIRTINATLFFTKLYTIEYIILTTTTIIIINLHTNNQQPHITTPL